jgi:hypothetical protein
MATEKIGIYRRWLGKVPGKNGKPVPKSDYQLGTLPPNSSYSTVSWAFRHQYNKEVLPCCDV